MDLLRENGSTDLSPAASAHRPVPFFVRLFAALHLLTMPAANLKKNPKAAPQTFVLDCTKPVDDGLMDAASFVRSPPVAQDFSAFSQPPPAGGGTRLRCLCARGSAFPGCAFADPSVSIHRRSS